MLKLQLKGGVDTVTGSSTILRYRGKKYLVDCGLFQGEKSIRDRNWQNFHGDPKDYSAVILTHAHLDHSGYLPRFCKNGFTGPIYCSHGSKDLCEILLLDAAYLEEELAGYANRSGYSHHKPALPLFTCKDAEASLRLFHSRRRNHWIRLDEGLSFRFIRAGHIIGASLVQFAVGVGGASRILTFTGDLGHHRSLTLKGPEDLIESDVMVIESTYGDRLHPREGVKEQIAAICQKTIKRRGVLLIPAFAVGRAQEVIYFLRQLEDEGAIDKVPVILDSPMSDKATKVYFSHVEDQKLPLEVINDKELFLPHHFMNVKSVESSMMACEREGPVIVISASGMLNGGRIVHHLKERIHDNRNTILFLGYQASGTKGRYLQQHCEEERTLRIHHKEFPIKCQVETVDGLSAHADYQDMVEYLARMSKKPQFVIVNHGEIASQDAMADHVEKELGIKAITAHRQDRFELWK